MTPATANFRQSTMLSLRPAADIGEAMFPYLAAMPELRMPEYQAAFRQRVIMLLNAAIRTPAYHKERIVDRPQTHRQSVAWDDDKPGGIVVNNPDLYAKRQDIGKEYAMLRISDDFCLGLSHIRSKRGEEGVREYLRTLDIETIVLIGKKVRTEQLERMHEMFAERNTFMYTEPIGTEPFPVRGYVSGNARQLVPDPPSIVTDVSQIAQWRNGMEEADSYLRFAEEQFSLTPDVCAAAFRSLGIKEYFDLIFEAVWQEVGCLELTLFNAVFCQRHGAAPIKRFIIPDVLFPAFRDTFSFDAQEKRWHMRDDEMQALRRICSGMFHDDHRAMQVLEMAFQVLYHNANAGAKRRHRDLPAESPVRIQRLFPSPSQQRKVELQAVNISKETLRACDLAAKRSKDSIDRQHPFNSMGKEILLSMEEGQLRKLAQRYPAGIEWHTLLLDETPDRVGRILADLFHVEDAVCRGVCAELVVLLLTMDASIFHSHLSIVDALNPQSKNAEKFRRESPQLVAVLKHLPREALHYCVDYCLRTSPKETAADEAAANDYVDNAECDSTGEEAAESAVDAEEKADRAIGTSIAHLGANYAEAEDALPVFRLENWHPHVFGKQRIMPTHQTIGVLRETLTRDLPKTVEYLGERGHIATEKKWLEILDDIHDKDLAALEPNPTLLRAILESAPPELTAGPCLALHYLELEKAIVEFLRQKKFTPYVDALDVPVDIFLDTTHERLVSHAAWKTRIFPLFSPELKENIRDFAEDHLCDPIRTLYPIFQDKGVNRILTKRSALTHRELPLLTTLCSRENHGLLRPIIRRALASPTNIQERLLTETLPLTDAALLACAIIGDRARAASDTRTIGDLHVGTWKTRTTAPLESSVYGVLHAALKKRPPLLPALVSALSAHDPVMTLAGLS